MVFVVNAVEDGPSNWAAFQAAAERLNGTMTTSTSSMMDTSTSSLSSSPSSRRNSGSASFQHKVVESSFAFVAVAIGALLV